MTDFKPGDRVTVRFADGNIRGEVEKPSAGDWLGVSIQLSSGDETYVTVPKAAVSRLEPAEPTGLCAVVEDGKGKRWVLARGMLPDDPTGWWYTVGVGSYFWSQIDRPITVLSEGVQP